VPVFSTAVFTGFGHRRLLPVWALIAATLWENFGTASDMLEMVTEMLNESPRDAVKSAFVHWKKDVSGLRTIMESFIHFS
jgi:hypothetical protein